MEGVGGKVGEKKRRHGEYIYIYFFKLARPSSFSEGTLSSDSEASLKFSMKL